MFPSGRRARLREERLATSLETVRVVSRVGCIAMLVMTLSAWALMPSWRSSTVLAFEGSLFLEFALVQAYVAQRHARASLAHPLAGAILLGCLAFIEGVIHVGGVDMGFAGASAVGLVIATGLLFLSWPWMVTSLAVVVATTFLETPPTPDAVVVISGVVAVAVIAHASRISIVDRGTRAAAAARENATWLRRLIETAPIGIMLVEASEGRIVQANDAASRMLAYAPGELLGRATRTLVHPDDVAAHLATMGKVASGEASSGVADRRMICKDGRVITVRARNVAVRSGDGQQPLSFGILEDVTESRALDKELRMRSTMLASVGQAVIATDAQGNISYWNAAATRLYGWEAAEVLGRAIGDVTVPSTSRAEGEEILAALLAGESWHGEFEVQRKDGSRFPALVTDAPVLAEDGKLVGVIGISEDLTERKQGETTLRRAERDAALGTLVAGVAHEINNPLQYLVGYSELSIETLEQLRADAALDATTRAALEDVVEHQRTMRRGLDQIASITKGLRQVSRKSNDPRRPEDVNAIAESVLRAATPHLGPDVDVTLDPHATRKSDANASEISQIVLNLLLNAGDAVAGRTDARVVVRTRDDGDRVLVEVEDNGVGVAPDARERIFVPFFTTKPQGTGLGLSVSRRIAEDHGGTLTFESEPGRTVFRLALPATPAPAQAARIAA